MVNLEAKLLSFIVPLTRTALKTIDANKDKSAASILALPTCFEYGYIGTQAYAKPNIEATIKYMEHLRIIWLGGTNEENNNDNNNRT